MLSNAPTKIIPLINNFQSEFFYNYKNNKDF